jgi:hypothetical protein
LAKTTFENKLPYRDIIRLQYFHGDLKRAKKVSEEKDVTRLSVPFIPNSCKNDSLSKTYFFKNNGPDQEDSNCDLVGQVHKKTHDLRSFSSKVDLIKARESMYEYYFLNLDVNQI